MRTSVKYFSDQLNELTLAQVQLVQEYSKEIFENEMLVKIERYKDSNLIGTEYFCNESEMNEILNDDPNAALAIKTEMNGYVVLNCLCHQNGVLVRKDIFVFDLQDKEICWMPYNHNLNEPQYNKCEKYIYDENGEKLYQFEYLEDGTCFKVHNLVDPMSDFSAFRIDIDPDLTFSWTGNEYYQFAYPIFPSPLKTNQTPANDPTIVDHRH